MVARDPFISVNQQQNKKFVDYQKHLAGGGKKKLIIIISFTVEHIGWTVFSVL
jgi:hypothetical protein